MALQRELCSTLSQIIRLKASDDVCLLNQSRSLTKSMEKSLDKCNSRILLIALNILQKQHTTNNELYSDLWKLNERTRDSSIQSCAVEASKKKMLTWKNWRHYTFYWQPDEGRWSGISFRNQTTITDKTAQGAATMSAKFSGLPDRSEVVRWS